MVKRRRRRRGLFWLCASTFRIPASGSKCPGCRHEAAPLTVGRKKKKKGATIGRDALPAVYPTQKCRFVACRASYQRADLPLQTETAQGTSRKRLFADGGGIREDTGSTEAK